MARRRKSKKHLFKITFDFYNRSTRRFVRRDSKVKANNRKSAREKVHAKLMRTHPGLFAIRSATPVRKTFGKRRRH